jgi:hypothetical protein
MPLFDLPSPSETLAVAGLKPEQANVKFQNSDLLSDIATKIEEEGSDIERRVLSRISPQPFPFDAEDLQKTFPKYSEELLGIRATGFLGTLRLATQEKALASLYRRSGQLNAAYATKAAEYDARAERRLTGSDDGKGTGGLLGELQEIAEAISAGAAEEVNGGPELMFIPAIGSSYCHDELSGYCC